MADGSMEIEVKFYISDPVQLYKRLDALGAKPGDGVKECDTCFDTAQNAILASGGLLRLRRAYNWEGHDAYDDCRLTFKRRPTVDDPDVKVFHELEVQVSDCAIMSAVLDELGYRPARVYEKKRLVYVLPNALVCVDTLPFGDFIEIEGPKTAIRKTARDLGLEWSKRILTNYLAIFDLLREKLGLECDNPTFAAFEGLDVSVGPYISHFEAGS